MKGTLRVGALAMCASIAIGAAGAHADPREGVLSPAAIRRVVMSNIGQVTRCHEAALSRHPNLTGRVMIHFTIGGNGAVLSSTPTENTTGDRDVGDCIAAAVGRWRFPAPEGGGVVTVNYPFNLQRAD